MAIQATKDQLAQELKVLLATPAIQALQEYQGIPVIKALQGYKVSQAILVTLDLQV